MIERQLRNLAIVSAVYLAVVLTFSLTHDSLGALAAYLGFASVLFANLYFNWIKHRLE